MNAASAWWRRVLVADAGELAPGRGARGTESYLLLPTPSDPRVVADVASGPAVAEALRRFAAARSLPAVVGSAVAALSPVVSKVAPSWTVEMDGDAASLRTHLSEALGRDVLLSIAVGPPRPNRKPVVRCWSGNQLIAVAKLGPDPHTEAMVRNEAEWLQRLTADPIDGVRTPDVLHHGRYGDSELLVMSVLPLVSDAGVPFAEVPGDRLAEFVDRHRADISGLAGSPWWTDLATRLADVADPVVRAALERSADDPAAADIATSAWHGDWSPWNVGRSTTGEWCIWDWERTTLGVPVGFDQLHLHHQYGDGLDAAGPALARAGVDGGHVPLVRRLYLLELTARHAESSSLDGDRHRIVLQLLEADAEGRGDTVARVEGAS